MKKRTIIISGTLVIAAIIVSYVLATDNKTTRNDVTDFASCAAAGNPIMESYPEQCHHNGTTYTNTSQQPQTLGDETDNWLSYTSPDYLYAVRVPDGWQMLRTSDAPEGINNLYGEVTTDQPGIKATIKDVASGWDSIMPFALLALPSTVDVSAPEGTKEGQITTAQGRSADKYVSIQSEPEFEGIGYEAGTVVYTYVFGDNSRNIRITHAVKPGAPDQAARVEQMIKTLHVY